MIHDDFHHELSLVFKTNKGLVVINSCSHGGFINIVENIKEIFNMPVIAYIGGLHLKGYKDEQEICILDDKEIKELCDYILKDINLEINKGDKVMLCGKSGSGKSTILKLLKKYDKVSNNSIFMDDIDINNYTKKAIDNNITYISQNEILFTDTLYNNILLKRNISIKKVMKLANLCYVNEIN